MGALQAVVRTPLRSWRESDVLLSLMAFGFCGLATFALLRLFEGKPFLLPVAFGTALAVGLFCLLSTRYTLTLGALMLFLGLADGYLKLRFGGLAITGLRDALLFSVCAGALMRVALSGERIRWPPWTALVAAWVAVVLVQLANPANGTFSHSLLALRSHIEWVPLFFFGYVVLRSKRRISGFLTIVLILAAVNGVVALYQYEAGPEAIAAWGPGYERLIFGGGDVSGRTFIDNSGAQRLRPPALGSDIGFGGILAVLAGPAAFVFLMLGRRRGTQVGGLLLSCGVVAAVLTAQVRIAIVGLAVALLAVVILSAASKRLWQAAAATAAVAVVALAAATLVSGQAGAGVFDRYESLTGKEGALNTVGYKRGTLAYVPETAVDHPFGQGLGAVGPAASIAGAPESSGRVSGESEFNFLLVEVGVPGLVALLIFQLTVLVASARRLRHESDPELRLLLSALVAALVAVQVLWFGGPVTAAPPAACFMWLVSGALAYWCSGTDDPSPKAAALDQPVELWAGLRREGHAVGLGSRHLRDGAELDPAREQLGGELSLTESEEPADAGERRGPLTSSMIQVRSAYPLRRARAIDAIDAYNRLLVEAFGRGEGIVATTCGPEDMLGPGCDVLLVQYNPFSYGRWGIAPSLVTRLATARRRVSRTHISLVVHEPYVAPAGWSTWPLAAWHRIQLFALTGLVDSVVVPSSDAGRRVGRFPRRPVVVPVGSNLPDRRGCRDQARQSLRVDPGDVVLVVFGASTAGRSMAHVRAAARAAAAGHSRVVLLVLGSGHESPGPVDGVTVERPGPLPADDVARLMAAGDVFLAPYDDGVSTRRGALMAALQHGLAVVGTDAGRSDAVLTGSHGLQLVPVDDVGAFAEAVGGLATDAAERRARGAAARRLYHECFDWDVIANQLLRIVHSGR